MMLFSLSPEQSPDYDSWIESPYQRIWEVQAEEEETEYEVELDDDLDDTDLG